MRTKVQLFRWKSCQQKLMGFLNHFKNAFLLKLMLIMVCFLNRIKLWNEGPYFRFDNFTLSVPFVMVNFFVPQNTAVTALRPEKSVLFEEHASPKNPFLQRTGQETPFIREKGATLPPNVVLVLWILMAQQKINANIIFCFQSIGVIKWPTQK